MSRVALLLLLSFFNLRAGAQDPSPNDLFQNGLAAYQNQRYDDARAYFERLLSLRPGDAHVMHNLALSYFKLEQKPLALAYWRKALNISPHYRPALVSREFLEQRMNMRPYERDPFKLWLRENLTSVSLAEASWLVAFLLAGSGFFWIRYASGRMTAIEDERPLPPFPSLALLLTAMLISSLVLTGMKVKQLATTRATVLASKASAHSLPAEDSVSVFDLNGGHEVIVRRRDGDWVQVQNSDGSGGWLRQSELLITSGE
jgi:tetratricopeptide (TPR) repeat protein